MSDEINTIAPEEETNKKPEIDPRDIFTRKKRDDPDFDWREHTANPFHAKSLSKFLGKKSKDTAIENIVLSGAEIYEIMDDETPEDEARRRGDGGVTDEQRERGLLRSICNLRWLVPLNNVENTLEEHFKIDPVIYQKYIDWLVQIKGGEPKIETVEKIIPPENVGLYLLLSEILNNSKLILDVKETDLWYGDPVAAKWFIDDELCKTLGINRKDAWKIKGFIEIDIYNINQESMLIKKGALKDGEILYGINNYLKLPKELSPTQKREKVEAYLKTIFESNKHIQETLI